MYLALYALLKSDDQTNRFLMNTNQFVRRESRWNAEFEGEEYQPTSSTVLVHPFIVVNVEQVALLDSEERMQIWSVGARTPMSRQDKNGFSLICV